MYLYYKKSGFMAAIKETNISQGDFIEITEKQVSDILNWQIEDSTNIIKVIDGEIKFIINETNKRQKIVQERNELLAIAERFVDRPTYTSKLGLTTEDLEDAEEYYIRLLDMPQHFDASDDKQNWKYVFVDVYTSGKNTDKYQLFKPSFVK